MGTVVFLPISYPAMAPEMGGGAFTMVLALHMFDEMAKRTIWG
jgi:hypothetical protein